MRTGDVDYLRQIGFKPLSPDQLYKHDEGGRLFLFTYARGRPPNWDGEWTLGVYTARDRSLDYLKRGARPQELWTAYILS